MRRFPVVLTALLAVVVCGLPVARSAGATSGPAALIERVPAATSVYGLRDSAGHTMDTAKVVADPTTPGRYLAVYHWSKGGLFLVGVATSTDLRTWTYRRTLDNAASQPSIAFSPAPKNGPVVAMEGKPDDNLRFRYWTSVKSMLAGGDPYVTFDAPKTLSKCAEGTPDIRSVRYGSSGSVINSGSTITVGHHYFANCATDRQAVGTLTNFKTWTTKALPDVDRRLTSAGGVGKHGDRDRFSYAGRTYTLVEAGVTTASTMADWRPFLDDGTTARRLTVRTKGGSTALANPSVTVLDDPAGVPSLLVSQFIPANGAAPGEAGQLLYWQPLGSASTPTSPPPVGTDPVVAAVGDIACAPGFTVTLSTCQHKAVSDKILADSAVGTFLALGDLQYDTGKLSSFQQSYDPTFGRLKAKTRPIPGNHEYGTAGAAGYFDYFGARAGNRSKGYYSFDVGAWHFVALNSEKDTAAGGAQLTWLKADLAAHRNACVAALWHKPRWSTGGHGNNAAMAPAMRLLYDYRAELVLSGHDHDYERFHPLNPSGVRDDARGVVQIVSGLGGKNHYGVKGGSTTATKNNTSFGYARLVLHPKSADVSYVPAVGSYTDRTTIRCH